MDRKEKNRKKVREVSKKDHQCFKEENYLISNIFTDANVIADS